MNMKTWRRAWIALAILLSNLMCATVAYRYCDMRWGIQYAGYGVPSPSFREALGSSGSPGGCRRRGLHRPRSSS